ncbi:MAG: SF1B family DNA helicase RecD2, partial [Solirubrobacteraceae bacterium]
MRFDGEVTVRFVRFANANSGWAALEAAGGDGTPVALVGPLAHLEQGERTHVIGEWVTDARFGRQVKVSQARPLPPRDPELVVGFLRRVRHVGVKRARALVTRYGPEGTFDAIDSDPESAFAVAGLRGARAAEAIESWQALRVTRRLHMLLAPHQLGYLAARLHERWGAQAYELVTGDPYQLTSVFGIGFQIADRIARGLGIADDSPERRRAALVHVLVEAERSGSTCLPVQVALEQAGELVGASLDAELAQRLVDRGVLVCEDGWLYRAATAALEAELARRVDELLRDECSAKLGGSARVPVRRPQNELTDEQQAGLRTSLEHRLSVITGGPGTGKTASIRAIANAATSRGAHVLLVAPTGRAAVRISESSGLRASTVHSALGWIPGRGPEHDAKQPLACDLLIVDETSMANLELLVTLLRAVAGSTHVVLVGDADQLAPVGAGKPFAELVGSPRVPVTRLTHIFRQAAGSMIVQGAHAIRRGEPPSFAVAEGMRRDLFLVARGSAREALDEIVTLVCERLPTHYGVDPVRDIQVFAPVYRGDLGIDALNAALRERLNPDGRPVLGGRLRIGDKLIMTGRNLHELGLMNGTVLRLLDEVESDPEGRDDAALILGADDAVFRLPPAEADRLSLAYACSIHRGQGIELPIAVIVAHPAAGAFFLRREMLYTAVTRARLATVVVGDPAVVARAAGTPDT